MSTEHVKGIIEAIGEDPERDGLLDTPGRVMRSWDHLFSGYRMDAKGILARSFTNEAGYDQMIMLRNIEMYSTCEHHMLPFFGSASVAYIPGDKGKVVGISKLARLVECYSRRLQIQERLTAEIADAMETHLEPRGTMVLIKACHFCMMARGVQKQNAEMITSDVRGVFREDEAARAEFLNLHKGG